MKGKAFLELTDDQQMKLIEVTEMACELMDDHGLSTWKFHCSSRQTKAQ